MSQEPKVIFGENCFAIYTENSESTIYKPWTVMKYDTEWECGLDLKSDALELMKRLDRRMLRTESVHALKPGI